MQSIELDFFVEDDEEPDVLCNVNRGNERSNGKDAATTTTAAAGNSKGGRKHVKRAMNCLRWRDLHHEAAEKFGKPMTTIRTWDDEMRAVGLVNVQRDVFMVSSAQLFIESKINIFRVASVLSLVQGS